MRMKRFISVTVAMLMLCLPVLAKEGEIEGEFPKVEVFGGYALLRSGGQTFHGWSTVLTGNVNRWLGVAGEISGVYVHESTPEGTFRESEHTFVVGPHFAYRHHPKLTPFAFTLLGLARESSSEAGVKTTENGFAAELGGGLDWEVHERMAIRLFEATASITRIQGHAQTKPKFAFGLVFLLGRK